MWPRTTKKMLFVITASLTAPTTRLPSFAPFETSKYEGNIIEVQSWFHTVRHLFEGATDCHRFILSQFISPKERTCRILQSKTRQTQSVLHLFGGYSPVNHQHETQHVSWWSSSPATKLQSIRRTRPDKPVLGSNADGNKRISPGGCDRPVM